MTESASATESSDKGGSAQGASGSSSASESKDVSRAGEMTENGMKGESARTAMNTPESKDVLSDTAKSVGNTPNENAKSSIEVDVDAAKTGASTNTDETETAEEMAKGIVEANTTRRNQRGGQPQKVSVNMDGVAADIVHVSRTDPALAGSVMNEAGNLVDEGALKASIDKTLGQSHLADAELLGDATPQAVPAATAQAKAAEIIGDNTNTQTTRGGSRTTVDVTEIAYDLQTLAKENPSLAVAAKGEVTSSLNAQQAADVNRMVSGDASWGEEIDMAFSHPVEGLKGVGKGIVNGFSAVGEMFAKGSTMNAAAQQQQAAGFSALMGNEEMAARQMEMGEELMDVAQTHDFVPSMSIDNMAQAGGEKVGMVIDVAMAGKGLITGGAKVMARNADELAGIAARGVDDIPTRAPVLNPTPRQVEAAQDLGVDPRWVDEAGNVDWPPNYGFSGTPDVTTLQPGTRIDRYGSERGGFLSPEGIPFEQRALPNSSADAPYTTYEVVKPMPVKSGEAAPWFGQPGGGMQYQLDGVNVRDMLEQGYLRVVE